MRLLLISDATMNENAGGLSQTLYNIFSFLKPEDILCITSVNAYNQNPPSHPFTSRYITYNFNFLTLPRNRFAKYFQHFFNWLNYSFAKHLRSLKKIKAGIEKFDPDIVVTCPNGAEGLLIHYKLENVFKHKKIFPYFMDDWMYHSDLKWLGGNTHQLTKKLLVENKSWLMISKNLAEILIKRYKTTPFNILAIHNPVNLSTIPLAYDFRRKDKYTIVYAGALWQMHFDAFLVVAQAVYSLKNKINVELTVYTKHEQWNWRKNDLEKYNVEYGGSIPYSEIHQNLAMADCLLVTSSFMEAWQTHSKGSIQTKLTDYLKAGRLIISCGPSYSANNHFIKTNNCGICIETNNVQSVANDLNTIFLNMPENKTYVANGYRLLQEEFSFAKVHKKLKYYLSTAHSNINRDFN